MRILLSLLLSLSFLAAHTASSQEHPARPVIIDTDCAPDDFRAINYFLSDPELEIKAITSVDGTIEPEEGYIRINALLKDLGHEGIRTSQGILTRNNPPQWRSIAKSISWGEPLVSYKQPKEIKEFLVTIIDESSSPVDVICMGPLTNIANAILMKPSIKKEINRIVWFDQCRSDDKNTNYGMDCPSADYILKTQIPIFRVKTGEKPQSFQPALLKKMQKIQTPYAQKIVRTHSADSIQKALETGHLKIWDDLTALFFFYPELFETDKSQVNKQGNIVTLKEPGNLQDNLLRLLHRSNQQQPTVLQHFPADTNAYQKDLGPHIQEIIQKNGLQEWKASILTHELHHHVGIYSVIGAKMGIRAVNYFHTTADHLQIYSDCGTNPPLSCMNDGIQAGSGCTLGNGKYHITNGNTFPRITVKYYNRKIDIKLASSYHNQIREIIQKGEQQYSTDSEEYWDYVRKNTFSIWKNWDRNSIFRISETKSN